MPEYSSDALYYPHMRIDNSEWIRSQLLYFDKIRTVSPIFVRDEPTGFDEAELLERGIVVRESPLLAKSAVERASRFVSLLMVMARSGGLASHFQSNPFYDKTSQDALRRLNKLGLSDRGAAIREVVPHLREYEDELSDLLSDKYVRIHPEKMEWRLQEFLRGQNNSNNFNELIGDWILVDPIFASIYMTALAREIAADVGVSCITDESVHDAIFQDVTATLHSNPLARNRRAEGVFVDVVMSAIKVRADTRITDILNFKERHRDELVRFRSLIYGLASRCAGLEATQIQKEAKLILQREIEPALNDLEKSLSGFGIVWTKSGIIKAASMMLGSIGGLATFDYSGSTPLALTSTIGIGLTGFALGGLGERRAISENSPYAYLLDLKRNFTG